MATTETIPMTMDMTLAVQGLVNLFLNMDGKSREMFIKLLVVKMEEEEVDLILEVVDMRNNSKNNLNVLSVQEDDVKIETGCDSKENRENKKIDLNNHNFAPKNDMCIDNQEKVKNPFSCDICLKSFYTSTDLKRHKNIHDGIKPFLCDQCPHASKSQSHLREHKQGCHAQNGSEDKPKVFLCEICSNSFKTHLSLKCHIRVKHTKNKVLKCDQCSYETSHFTAMKDHKRTHTGERPFVCHICSKTFNLNQHLNRHIKGVHLGEKTKNTGEKNYLCDLCSSGFASQQSLSVHKESIHEGVKFHCDQCGHKASSRGNLIQHIAAVHEGITFDCEECDYKVSSKQSLRIHEESVHLGIRHMCNQCDFKATCKSGLIQHVANVHEHIQRDCKKCDYTTFKRRAFLKHMTGHRNAQEIQKTGLKNHLEIHTGVKPYSCDQCLKRFYRKHNLKHHRSKFHSISEHNLI